MKAAKKPGLGVVILGAGASARMGQPKLLLPWQGTTVIGHLISQWQALGAAQIAVVLRAKDVALTAELGRLNLAESGRIKNPHPERGMFSSIVCAADWDGWRREISSWALVLGDQPHLRAETLRQLLACSALNRAAICQPAFDGRARHPVIFPRPAMEELKNSSAATLKDFLKLTTLPRVHCPVADSGLTFDLDTPEDYRILVDYQGAHEPPRAG
jgi:molybdenum cofactor cytidylyltransferase